MRWAFLPHSRDLKWYNGQEGLFQMYQSRVSRGAVESSWARMAQLSHPLDTGTFQTLSNFHFLSQAVQARLSRVGLWALWGKKNLELHIVTGQGSCLYEPFFSCNLFVKDQRFNPLASASIEFDSSCSASWTQLADRPQYSSGIAANWF